MVLFVAFFRQKKYGKHSGTIVSYRFCLQKAWKHMSGEFHEFKNIWPDKALHEDSHTNSLGADHVWEAGNAESIAHSCGALRAGYLKYMLSQCKTAHSKIWPVYF